ncbi:S8 family serine peptidase [bacterium]|nr:S8 family serine peptidase [bacterium]
MITQFKKYTLVLSLLSSTTYALNHQELMWGLNNKGTAINPYINPLQGYKLQAIAGEDIRLASPVKGRKVKVAVLDTGFDFTHADLQGVVARNAAKCEALEKLKQCQEAKDADENACREEHLKAPENIYPADCQGWSILDQKIKNTPNNIIGRPDFSDRSGHGTHVAGIISSVSSNVEIIPVQVIGDGPNQPIKPFSIDLAPSENVRNGYQTEMLSERVSRGIIYAMNAGAEVINLSIGWPEDQNTDIIKEAIAEAQRRGIIIVAAAGNDSTNALLRPCQYKGVICVGAHSPDGSLSSFSNFGFGVDIAAPGVEVLSTIPNDIRSLRFPGHTGYDFMSGTSQATPFVTGVVADMLARGISAKEIYPRLMLGARPVKKELPLLVGPVNGTDQAVDASAPYTKTVLSGLLDMTRSLKVEAQALILPADKEVQYINWDRKSTDLKFSIALKNYWKDIKGQKVQVTVKPSVKSELEPEVVSVQAQQDLNNWAGGEEKSLNIQLKIKDQSDASLSRLPSELSYQVIVSIDGKAHRKFEVKATVLVNITEAITGGDVYGYDLVGQIPRGMKMTLVDEILDAKQAQRDYFLIGKDEKDKTSFDIALVRASQKSYQVEAAKKMKFDGDLSLTRPQYKVRVDLDGDGNSEYIYGIIEYLDKEATIYGDYRNHFYIFDNNMQLKQYVIFDDKRAALPYQFYWMKVKGQMRPAWVGKGQEVSNKVDVTDLWGVDDSDTVVKNYKTKSDIHFYYLDENFKLQQLESDVKENRIVDIIQTSLTQAQQGLITVLMAKNMGTETKPSYINEFSVATVVDGKIATQTKLDTFSGGLGYRNLVDTFADKTLSMASEASEYRGTMWYGLEAHQKQRVTLIDVEQKQIFDKMISSQRAVQDSALLVKAGFQSKNRKGVFLITNSELEYHDLGSEQVVGRSLNRYSFFGDQNFVELYFPITLVDRMNSGQKLPALFTTEQSGLSRGIRMLVPVYGKDGKLQQMVTPARLRLKSEKGCKPLESPVYLGENSGYAMDYQCGAKILRFLLKY